MYYVKTYTNGEPNNVLKSFDDFETALRFKISLIRAGDYKEEELCIENFLR